MVFFLGGVIVISFGGVVAFLVIFSEETWWWSTPLEPLPYPRHRCGYIVIDLFFFAMNRFELNVGKLWRT